MIELTIEEQLEIIRLTRDIDLRVPLPTDCQALLERARASGIPVRNLYALRAPLSPHTAGAFVRADSSVWVVYEPSRPDGLEDTLRSLFYAFAAAGDLPQEHATIDDDWDDVRRRWERAARLSHEWECGHLFPSTYLTDRLAEVEVLREQHWSAGYLAGSLSAVVARAAYSALCCIRQREGWNTTFFGEALGGISDDERVNRLVLDFDRCQLGRSWSYPIQQGDSFGPMALPSTQRSDDLLRSALNFCAEHPAVLNQLRWIQHTHQETEHCFLQVEDGQDFFSAIGVLNALLLEDVSASKRVTWHCYGDGSRSIGSPAYRLSLSYSGSDRAERERLAREVWVLFPSRHVSHQVYEAALQRYIASWLSFQGLVCEGVREGQHALWEWLR